MSLYLKKSIAVSLLYLIPFACLAEKQASQDLVGQAFDGSTNTPIYQERHSFKMLDGKQTMHSSFTNLEGMLIGERTVEFAKGRVASYRFEQEQLGTMEQVVRHEKQLEMTTQQADKTKRKSVRHKNASEVVIDAGFSNYILRNWDTLRGGDKLTFDFATPAKKRVVRFTIQKVALPTTSAAKHEVQRDVAMFKMTIANPVFRLLLKPIEIGYYQDTKRLAYYKGISNVSDIQGRLYSSVRIHYENSDLASR